MVFSYLANEEDSTQLVPCVPVLPGLQTIFWPVHEKSAAKKEIFSKNFFGPFSAKYGHKFFQLTFFSPAPFELFGWNFGHLATLAAAQPPTPPLPLLPSFSPLPSLRALQLTAEVAKY
jgi:hypothetical protein